MKSSFIFVNQDCSSDHRWLVMQTTLSFLTEGVHNWHNDSLWSVDYIKGLNNCYDLGVKGQVQINLKPDLQLITRTPLSSLDSECSYSTQ